MKTKIENITLCRGVVNGKIDIVYDAQININQNIIKYAGEAKNAPLFEADKVIDGRGSFAMPGMFNMHTHTPMTMLRSVGGNLCLEDWLNNEIFPREKKLSDEHIYIGSLLGIMEMLRYGTTNYCDMYFNMDMQAKAVSDSRMRAVLGHGSVSFVEGDLHDHEEGVDFALRWNDKENGRIKTSLAPHSTYLTNDSLLKAVSLDAKKYSLPIHTHISETKTEVNTVLSKFGRSPVKVLEDYGILENNVVSAHCVWLSDDDINIVKKYKFTAVHNPVSNLKLASGIAPIYKYLNNNINVAIGTDGVASNNNLNLWQEMTLMPLLQKGNYLDPTIISTDEALYAATLAGAKAFDYNDLGLIKEGYKADIILVDINTASCVPNNSISDDIVYSAQGSDVFMTMVDGDVLYMDGKYTYIDKEYVFKEARKLAKSL